MPIKIVPKLILKSSKKKQSHIVKKSGILPFKSNAQQKQSQHVSIHLHNAPVKSTRKPYVRSSKNALGIPTSPEVKRVAMDNDLSPHMPISRGGVLVSMQNIPSVSNGSLGSVRMNIPSVFVDSQPHTIFSNSYGVPSYGVPSGNDGSVRTYSPSSTFISPATNAGNQPNMKRAFQDSSRSLADSTLTHITGLTTKASTNSLDKPYPNVPRDFGEQEDDESILSNVTEDSNYKKFYSNLDEPHRQVHHSVFSNSPVDATRFTSGEEGGNTPIFYSSNMSVFPEEFLSNTMRHKIEHQQLDATSFPLSEEEMNSYEDFIPEKEYFDQSTQTPQVHFEENPIEHIHIKRDRIKKGVIDNEVYNKLLQHEYVKYLKPNERTKEDNEVMSLWISKMRNKAYSNLVDKKMDIDMRRYARRKLRDQGKTIPPQFEKGYSIYKEA